MPLIDSLSSLNCSECITWCAETHSVLTSSASNCRTFYKNEVMILTYLFKVDIHPSVVLNHFFNHCFFPTLLPFSMSIHVSQSSILRIISESYSSEALSCTLLVATLSVISHLGSHLIGFTSSQLLSPPHLHPHLSLFLVSRLTWRWWVVRQFWCYVRRDWTTTAEQLLSPSLSYLFFLCAT